MAAHRVSGVNQSPEGGSLNPPAYCQPIDFERCAALHNHLMERGLEDRGLQIDAVTSGTWWDIHGAEIDDVEQKIQPGLREFLKLVRVPQSHSTALAAFFWNIDGIPAPSELFDNGISEAYKGLDTLDHNIYDDIENLEQDDEDSEDDEQDAGDVIYPDRDQTPPSSDFNGKYRFVTLYKAQNTPVGHNPIGVVFDQKHHMAVYVSAATDIETLINGHNIAKLNPLECILDVWHQLMDRGKVVCRYGQWQMLPFCADDLAKALQSWDDLVEDIEKRMGQELMPPMSEAHCKTLLDPRVAQSLPLSDFRRQFLITARRPRFRYIAPGMRVPTSEELVDRIQNASVCQADESHAGEKSWEPPLLLFGMPHSDDTVPGLQSWPSSYRTALTQQVSLTDPNSHESLFPYARHIRPEAAFAPGLYFSSTGCEVAPAADGFRLILPFTLGLNGFATRLDATWEVGEKEVYGILGVPSFHSSPRYGDLYQLGNGVTRGIIRHDNQLFTLFRQWKRQVDFGTGGWNLLREGAAGVIGREAYITKGVTVFDEHADSIYRSGNYVAGPSRY